MKPDRPFRVVCVLIDREVPRPHRARWLHARSTTGVGPQLAYLNFVIGTWLIKAVTLDLGDTSLDTEGEIRIRNTLYSDSWDGAITLLSGYGRRRHHLEWQGDIIMHSPFCIFTRAYHNENMLHTLRALVVPL